METPIGLKGEVALVTGADSGIGRAVAVLFAREGADVPWVYDRRQIPVACPTAARVS